MWRSVTIGGEKFLPNVKNQWLCFACYLTQNQKPLWPFVVIATNKASLALEEEDSSS